MLIYTRRAFDMDLGQIRPALLRVAACHVGMQAAPDIVQRALLAGWMQISRFDASGGPGALLAWLSAFVRYAALDWRRDQARRGETAMGIDAAALLGEIADDGAADLALLWTEYCRELRRRMKQANLTPRQQECIDMWLSGASLADVGACLGVAPKSAWEHIEAAKAKIRRTTEAIDHQIWEIWREESSGRFIYRAPAKVGAGVARASLRQLTRADQGAAAKRRRKEGQEI